MFGLAGAGAGVYTRPNESACAPESSAAGTSCSCTAPCPRLISNAPYRRIHSSGVSPSAAARSGSPGTECSNIHP